MDANWRYDPLNNSILHGSGFQIIFRGEPETDYFSGLPRRFPQGMSSVEVAVLIREGFDYFRKVNSTRHKTRVILMLKAGSI